MHERQEAECHLVGLDGTTFSTRTSLFMEFQLTRPAAALGLRLVAWCEHGLDNRKPPATLNVLRDEVYSSVAVDAKRDAVIEGYGTIRKTVGRSIRRFPPSPAALRAQFERRGELVSISPAVDIYNLVSLATGLSIGAHTLDAVQGDIRLDITRGQELFLPLGSVEEKPLPAGEYAYLDAADRVLCRLEYRQSAYTCLGPDSRNCVFIVQGHLQTPMAMLEQVADRVSGLLAEHCASRRGETWRLD